jgi:hypothetical protein
MSKPKSDPPLPRNGFGTTDLADPKELDLSPEQREKLTGISTYGLPRNLTEEGQRALLQILIAAAEGMRQEQN